MGNYLFTGKGTADVCHATLETCKTHCPTDCMFVDKCNDVASQYACVVLDSRALMWIIVVCFLIVILCCSGLVACYVCRAFRYSFRNAQRTNNDIVFHNARRVDHIQYAPPPRQSRGPNGYH